MPAAAYRSLEVDRDERADAIRHNRTVSLPSNGIQGTRHDTLLFRYTLHGPHYAYHDRRTRLKHAQRFVKQG